MRKGKDQTVALIADDDLFIRKVLSQLLRKHTGLVEAADGNEVLTVYKEYSPDIVFLDIHMPHIDGLQLIKDIKGFDPNAYIVMITADSKMENVQNAVKSGANGFIAKPFDKETVLKTFKRCPGVKMDWRSMMAATEKVPHLT